MFKRTMTAALAASLAALTIPTLASGSWFHSGVALKSGENPQISTLGYSGFVGELGGVDCSDQLRMTLAGGTTTGEINQIGPIGAPTVTCKTTGLLPLIGCTKVESVSNTGLPWTLHKNSNFKIQVTTGTIHYTLYNNTATHCAVPDIHLNPGNFTLDVSGFPDTINKFTLSGKLQTSEGESVEVYGSQSVNPGGTYGLTS